MTDEEPGDEISLENRLLLAAAFPDTPRALRELLIEAAHELEKRNR